MKRLCALSWLGLLVAGPSSACDHPFKDPSEEGDVLKAETFVTDAQILSYVGEALERIGLEVASRSEPEFGESLVVQAVSPEYTSPFSPDNSTARLIQWTYQSLQRNVLIHTEDTSQYSHAEGIFIDAGPLFATLQAPGSQNLYALNHQLYWSVLESVGKILAHEVSPIGRQSPLNSMMSHTATSEPKLQAWRFAGNVFSPQSRHPGFYLFTFDPAFEKHMIRRDHNDYEASVRINRMLERKLDLAHEAVTRQLKRKPIRPIFVGVNRPFEIYEETDLSLLQFVEDKLTPIFHIEEGDVEAIQLNTNEEESL